MATFGLHLTTYPEAGSGGSLPAQLRELGAALEATGVFGTLWLTDHMQHLGPGGPTLAMPESHLVLAAVAAMTTELHLGMLATSVLYRRPALLAKMVTTLDVLSGGRATLGIGAGHPRTEGEVVAYGYDFPPLGERMAMLEQALTTIRAMTGATPSADAAPNWPRPANPGGIPILVAGSGEHRLLRIAAAHADMINLSFPSGDTLDRLPHKLDVLAKHHAAVGRDPESITVTYKALLAVAPSRRDAQQAWDRWRQGRGLPDLDHRAGVFVGEPGDIAEQVRPFLDAGVQHLVVELVDPAEPKAVALAAEALEPLAAASADAVPGDESPSRQTS